MSPKTKFAVYLKITKICFIPKYLFALYISMMSAIFKTGVVILQSVPVMVVFATIKFNAMLGH